MFKRSGMIMKKFAAALVGVAMLGTWPLVSSYAQEEKAESAAMPELIVLVVNRQQVFVQSKAGQDMRSKLKSIMETIEADEKVEIDKVIADAQALVQKKAIMASEEFKKQQLELAQREEFTKYKFNQERNASRAEAQEQIASAMLKILQDLMQETNGTLLLDQTSLIMSSMEYDVTSQTVARLDQALPTVEVKRVTFDELVERQKAAEEQAKAAAGEASE
ncbi:MAG: OmpH family outer membrane protein [Alphaproteobacteria bacterium]|nr:MAG: OmpH family outer membrane protein [Alphaproteobacteria bacterium]